MREKGKTTGNNVDTDKELESILSMSDKEILQERENGLDDLLEALYWEFDNESKKGEKSARDIFKSKVRRFADSHSGLKDCKIMILNEIIKSRKQKCKEN